MDKKVLIKSILYKSRTVSTTTVLDLYNILDFKKISKGTTFIKQNTLNDYEYFILNGICRSYLLSKEGEEISLSFNTAPMVLTPHIARTANRLSNLNFQALTDLELGICKMTEFAQLRNANREIRDFSLDILQQELKRKIDKEIQNAVFTAKERLIAFREEFPLLENSIPHPYIASYLGITNVSLSRLRKQLIR